MRTLVAGVPPLPHAGSLLASLDGALAGDDPEYRGLVEVDGDRVTGVVIYGSTAGAEGAGRLYLVATDRAGPRRATGAALIEAAVQALGAGGHRFVVAEVPDDPSYEPIRALLARSGFRTETAVSDFYRDGLGLTILRRDCADAG